VPAALTLITFVEDTIQNYHSKGEMTDEERAAFLQQLEDLKKDPAWQTDAERAVPAPTTPPPDSGSTVHGAVTG